MSPHSTPMKDAAVNRLAKSITQLTLCQVTTSEVDAATKLLDKHARSFKTSKISHRRGSLTSKLPYANFAKLTVSWIVAQFPPVTKLAKRRKPYCCCHIQPKGQAHHRKSSMHKYRHALMSIISHTMKIICRSTGTLIFFAHRNDGAMRHVLPGYRSLTLVATSQMSLALGLASKHH